MNYNNLNEATINQTITPYSLLSEVWLINFAWFDMTECWRLYVRNYDYDDLWVVWLETAPYPFIDWWAVLSYLIERKTLNFKMLINADDNNDLNGIIDNLKRRLSKKEQPLDIVVNWVRRRTLASLTDLKINRQLSNQQIQTDIDITFETYSPHFWIKDPITTASTEQTTWSFAIDMDNWWSALSDYKITVIFWTGNSWIDTITLNKDWFVLSIPQTITDWDVLVIDGEKKEVLYNWVSIDYDWVFRRLDLGSNPMLLTMNWSSHNYWVTMKFLEQYK